jgi:hypothetical protein
MNERHLAKIRGLHDALILEGYRQLDEQASVLGLSRSTTWSIVQGKHKTTGLCGSVIKQMLAQPRLPKQVRIKILEYIDEKCAGHYGHNPQQVRRFVAALSRE